MSFALALRPRALRRSPSPAYRGRAPSAVRGYGLETLPDDARQAYDAILALSSTAEQAQSQRDMMKDEFWALSQEYDNALASAGIDVLEAPYPKDALSQQARDFIGI